jgi:uroporphyrinogen III methyltransferase / synthase
VRVVVTRPHGQAAELARRIRDLGHEVASEPLIEIEPVGPDEIDAEGYDWVVVTSPNGADELARRIRGRPERIAAIGPGTAAALRAHDLEPRLVPRVSSQEGLLAEMPRPAGRVLFVAAEGARTLLPDELDTDVIHVYRTIELRPESFPDADLVVLASPSAARAYAALELATPTVSIGPETSRAAREGGVTVVAEADPHDLDGLVEAVRQTGQ